MLGFVRRVRAARSPAISPPSPQHSRVGFCHLNLVSKVRAAISIIGGQYLGVGPGKVIHLELPDGRPLKAFPTLGVPTSQSMHSASRGVHSAAVAVVYEPIGLLPDWIDHLQWLGQHIRSARWVDVARVAWDLADWSEPR